MFKVILGVLLFTIITLVVFINIDPNISHSLISSSSMGSLFTVSIEGQVVNPGTYVMERGQTLGDLIDVSGGTTDLADPLAFHQSVELIHALSYYIAPATDPSDVCGETLFLKVGLNTGTKEALMGLETIGASLAQSIIDYRDTSGTYDYLEEIMNVSGIGNSTFSKIKNHITLA